MTYIEYNFETLILMKTFFRECFLVVSNNNELILPLTPLILQQGLNFFLLFSVSWIFFRYVKSKSEQQLLHGLKSNDTSTCKPQESNNHLPIVPCGLIAWSLFNDTYTFVRGRSELKVNRKSIAWKSDRDHKFGKHVYPFNFQNGTLIGGGNLDPSIPVGICSGLKF